MPRYTQLSGNGTVNLARRKASEFDRSTRDLVGTELASVCQVSGTFANHFRRGSSSTTAVAVFTDRVQQLDAFVRSVGDHADWSRSIDPTDPDLPRRNILNFYGIGGIGKSTLLRKLMREIPDSTEHFAASLLVDFQEPTSFSTEDFILRLRTTVGELGRHCPAFDLALAFYWATVHPDTPLSAYTRKNTVLHRASEKVGLSEEVQNVVADVASAVASASAIAASGTRLAALVAKKLRESGRKRHAIQSCPILPMFLDANEIESALTYLPSLLAWDLAEQDTSQLVVFLDTFEEVTARGRQVERLFERMVYLLPNVLFVIAGRNKLDWHRPELTGALDFVGPECWPDLESAASGRTWLVGDLSAEDADTYLQDRLRVGDSPAIPAHIRAQLVTQSGGWPIYLDLAVESFQQASREGAAPWDPLDKSFPALVHRLVSDLTFEERSVIFASSLYSSFDEDLIFATVGNVGHAVVQAALARPFVQEDFGALWPLSLHVALRNAIKSDLTFWSRADWHDAAIRACTELERRAQGTTNRLELGACVAESLLISHEYELPVSWISGLARRLAAAGGLEVVALPGASGTAASALAALLAVIARRGTTTFRQWAADLADCEKGGLTPEDIFWAHSLRADALLSAGDVSAAEDTYQQILASPPTVGPLLTDTKTMFALTLLRRSAFAELKDFADANSEEVNASRIRGDVYRSNAMWTEARLEYQAGLNDARKAADIGLQRLFLAELALVDGWSGDSDPAQWFEFANDEAELWTRCSMLLASSLFQARSDPDSANALLAEASDLAENFEMADVRLDIVMVRAFIATLANDHRRLSEEIAEFGRHRDRVPGYDHWRQILHWWHGDEATDSEVQWLGGAKQARQRWDETRQRQSDETIAGG
jgi:tetratricopeptide (TPR) repeat protein